MFSFHVTFSHLTKENVTYSRSNSGRFSKYCSTIFVVENMSVFLCFMLDARHCSAIYLYKKRYYAQHWNVSWWGVCMHQLQTSPLLFLRTPSCEVHGYNILQCGSSPRKNVSDLAGILSHQTRRFWYNIVPITFPSCLDIKCVFIRYLIGPMEFEQWANTWDFISPNQNSFKASSRYGHWHTVIQSIEQIWPTVSGTTKLFLHDVVTDKIRIFHWCGP